ncbi:MAG: AsmA-like C-terminal region-containing protein [Owenweeksia sp.]
MKRLLQILGFLILLLLVAAFVLPIVFKDEIIARAKTEINKNLDATVDFKDIDITLFKSFPDFTLDISEFTVDGKNEFDGTRLAEVNSFRLDLDLFSVISGNEFEVEGITVKDATIYVLVDENGKANYDIVKPGENEVGTDTSGPSDFKLTLKSYQIENLDLTYDDREGDIKVVLKDLDHEGVGDFTQEVVNLKTKTSIAAFTTQSGGVAYLSEVKTQADMDFEFNQSETKLTFGENKLNLNELVLNFTGYVAVPGDDITMDLKFDAPQNEFKNVLSLIPVIYTQDFEKVKTSGNFALNGAVSGTYNGEQEVYPAFDVQLNVNSATFRYPDLPAAVEGIKVNAHIYNKTANLDGTVIDIPEARAVVAGSPIDARLNLKTPMSDPQFAAYLKTDLELANLGKVVPAKGFDYKGRIKADLDLAGRMSDIDNERYENVKAEGVFMAQNVELKSDSLPYTVQIAQMDMQFSPQKVDLSSFRGQLGKSDISANGKIDNLIGYVLEDQLLKADFTVNSNLLDLNELSGGDQSASGSASADTSSALEVIRIPENVDFNLTASVGTLLYDNLEITNVKGNLALREGAIRMDNLVMDLLSGSLALNGSYDSKPDAPVVDMNLKINNFSFKESFQKFVTIQKLAPIMENTTGSYSSGFSFKTSLNPDMSPDLASVEAAGSLITEGMKTTTRSMQKLADIVKNQSLANLDVGKVNLSFKIQDGRVQVEPFQLKTGNISATVQGSNGLDP